MRAVFDSDNLIYNRFDVIYPDHYKSYVISFDNVEYHFQYVIQDNGMAKINIWGKEVPQQVFDNLIQHLFERYDNLNGIQIRAAGNNYDKQLEIARDIVLHVPREGIWNALKSRSKYNLNRKVRLLENEIGKIEVSHIREMDNRIVQLYFHWKMNTHGRDYHLSSREYWNFYHITDAIVLKTEGREVGLVFFNINKDTAYLENLSYDINFSKYSPGLLAYAAFLENAENRGAKHIFLGGGGLAYKNRFGTTAYNRFNGIIYSNEVFLRMNLFFQTKNIRKVAIYGLGNVGREFIRILPHLEIDLLFGIDRESIEIEGMDTVLMSDIARTMTPDLIIITIDDVLPDVEIDLKNTYGRDVLYYRELIDKIGCER